MLVYTGIQLHWHSDSNDSVMKMLNLIILLVGVSLAFISLIRRLRYLVLCAMYGVKGE